ncbi:GNAT family N-acetyltransferase [Fusibacter ferrireducens]|uniref:GNAT family N-acetyltransferase n=1 Tax=Fusibacter ferrireducens TaxID=2785058 RepID=A0ABR9ZT13_9FIRM|nr:GNAT family N-acetyltransferase [Fusibacter ferrireducens]MBF4693273.1 GNAT family N-acetyltransferase [Fusibacter ferrireducens]
MKRIYETERLILKVLDESYAESVMQFYIKNKDFLEPFEHTKSKTFYTLENHKLTLRLEEEAFLKMNMVRFWLFKKEDTQFERPIGSLALTNIIRGVFKSCFLGYKMDKDEINKGYMTEAIQAVVKIAFGYMKLHRIEANIMPRNERSIKVVEKCGFVKEGLARQYLKINGIWEDHYHMVILNEDDV